MITSKIDISGLNRHELAELRDEVDFELALHDAEMRAFYGVGILPVDEPDECYECEGLTHETEDLRDAIDAAIDALSDEDLTYKARVRRATERLELR